MPRTSQSSPPSGGTVPSQGAPSRALVIAAFAIIYIVWGSTYLAIRVAIDTLPPFLMAGARFLIAGSVLYAWARIRGAPGPGPGLWRVTAILGALFLLIGNGGVVWAEQTVPSGMAAVIVAMLPIWTALIEWIRPPGRRPGTGVLIGLVTGFMGVALLLIPGTGAGEAVDPIGGLVLVLASLSWAYAGIISKEMRLPESSALSSGMQMLMGGGMLVLLGLATGEAGRVLPEAVSLRSLAAFGYLVVFGSIIAFSAFVWLLRVSTPGRVATYAYVNPVVAVLLGWSILGEPLGVRDLAAAAVIIAGVMLITSTSRKPR